MGVVSILIAVVKFFEECAFCIKDSSLQSKIVFVVICTGGKGLSDFCKSSSTTVEWSDFYVKVLPSKKYLYNIIERYIRLSYNISKKLF